MSFVAVALLAIAGVLYMTGQGEIPPLRFVCGYGPNMCINWHWVLIAGLGIGVFSLLFRPLR